MCHHNFDDRPTAGKQAYRLVVIRKCLDVHEQGRLFEDDRDFFDLTNDREPAAQQIVFSANDCCNQENLLAQLKSGARAFAAPVDNLTSNRAWMAMTALAWNLKAWPALSLPARKGHVAEVSWFSVNWN